MTREEQKELMDLIHEQMRQQAEECKRKAEIEQVSADAAPKMSDNEAVDRMMQSALNIATQPRLAYAEWCDARMEVTRLRAKAEGIGGMRLSHDKVTGGQPPMMDDEVAAIIEAEEKVSCLWRLYRYTVSIFNRCLDRAVTLGKFSTAQREAWKLYFGGEYRSLQDVADLMMTSKGKVTWLVDSVKAKTTWCQTVDSVINECDYVI